MEKKAEFLEELKNGVVTVEFMKINDGGKRVMPCTLNPELSNHNVPEILEQVATNDNFVVWATDVEAWRSFRVSTVIEWYKGQPREEVQT